MEKRFQKAGSRTPAMVVRVLDWEGALVDELRAQCERVCLCVKAAAGAVISLNATSSRQVWNAGVQSCGCLRNAVFVNAPPLIETFAAEMSDNNKAKSE